MTQIAKEAGVSPATAYNHFPERMEDVYSAIVHSKMDVAANMGATIADMSLNPIEKIQESHGGPFIAGLKSIFNVFGEVNIDDLRKSISHCRNFQEEINKTHLINFLINSKLFSFEGDTIKRLYKPTEPKIPESELYLISIFKEANRQILPIDYLYQKSYERNYEIHYKNKDYNEEASKHFCSRLTGNRINQSPFIYASLNNENTKKDIWDYLNNKEAICTLVGDPNLIDDNEFELIFHDEEIPLEALDSRVNESLKKSVFVDVSPDEDVNIFSDKTANKSFEIQESVFDQLKRLRNK